MSIPKLEKLIPTYTFKYGIENDKQRQDKFIKKSVVAEGKEEVTQHLISALEDKFLTDEVRGFINLLLSREEIISKIKLVNDGSWANCSFLIKKDVVWVTHTGGYHKIKQNYSKEEILEYFILNAETIIINFKYNEYLNEPWTVIGTTDIHRGSDNYERR